MILLQANTIAQKVPVVVLNNNFWPMYFIRFLMNICKKISFCNTDIKIQRLDTAMFSNAKLCNHNIAKHKLSLQYQKKSKICSHIFEELKMQSYR